MASRRKQNLKEILIDDDVDDEWRLNLIDDQSDCSDLESDKALDKDQASDEDEDQASNENDSPNTNLSKKFLSGNNSSKAALSNKRSLKNDLSEKKLFFIGKDKKTEWLKTPPQSVKTPQRNIVSENKGVKNIAKNCSTPIDCWKLFFPDDTIDQVVLFTNLKLTELRQKYSRERDCLPTDREEIHALLGVLYLTGIMKMSHVCILDLWSKDDLSPKYFQLVMSSNRFALLLRALRFDDITTRKERKKVDKFAPIRDIWQEFCERCIQMYTPSPYLTIDEMISAFRGKCSFKQYVPSKPDKYGLKTFAIVDVTNNYTINMEMYLGKQPGGPFQTDNSTSSIIKRIAQPILKTGRNITMDNWFTSIPLIRELMEKFNTTVVGTIKKNKRELPLEFTEPSFLKKRPVHSSLFGFHNNMTLVSYKAKRNKDVVLASSMHSSASIDQTSGNRQKPEIITFYNATKSGVDVVDKLKATYNVARSSCRWSLTTFFTLMNVAGINSQVIYELNTKKSIERKKYLKIVAKELTKSLMIRRMTCNSLPRPLRDSIREALKIPNDKKKVVVVSNGRRVLCEYCPSRLNHKTSTFCASCQNPICGTHTYKICVYCNEKNVADNNFE